MEIEIPAHRMYHQANWDQFTQIIRDSYINIPSEMTECKLDKMVNKLNHCAVPINGHIGCYMHGTSMGTIHLSRNLLMHTHMYIASI